MITIENTVLPSPEQWKAIVRGMRQPKKSHHRSDSVFGYEVSVDGETSQSSVKPVIDIGDDDHDLMLRLAAGGPVHAKYRRAIPVFVDVTAPLYWWKEFDTYKIGTTRNSASTMHKIHTKEFVLDDFSHEACIEVDYAYEAFKSTIDICERLRQDFNATQDRTYWKALIELLPSGFNMISTLTLNYEVLVGIYRWRKNHKLKEWHTFCDWIESLPYSEIIIGASRNMENEDM